MTFFPVDMVLLVALVMTTACVVLVYRKLKELEAHQAHYERGCWRKAPRRSSRPIRRCAPSIRTAGTSVLAG